MIEHIGALRGVIEVHLGRELHRLLLGALQRDLGDVPVRQHEHGLALLVDEDLRGEVLAPGTVVGRGWQRGQLLGFLLPQLVLPEDEALLVLAQVEELFAVRGQGHVLQARGVDRQALGAVLVVLELDVDGLLLLVLLLFFLGVLVRGFAPVGGLVFLVLFLLGVVLGLLDDLVLGLAELEAVVGLLVEEKRVNVHLRRALTPAGAVQPLAVAGPQDRLAVAGEGRAKVLVTAVGKVGKLLLAFRIDDPGLARPAVRVVELHGEPFAVRRPVEPLVTVGVGKVMVAGEDQARLFGVEVEHLERRAVFQVGDLLAVGRVAGLKVLLAVVEDGLDVHHGGVEEIRFLLLGLLDAGLIKVP